MSASPPNTGGPSESTLKDGSEIETHSERDEKSLTFEPFDFCIFTMETFSFILSSCGKISTLAQRTSRILLISVFISDHVESLIAVSLLFILMRSIKPLNVVVVKQMTPLETS